MRTNTGINATDAIPREGDAAGATLRGPEVEARTERATLVRRGFGGRLVRLEVPPAEAALDLIEIDDDARQRVIAILDSRAAAMDKVVLDHLDLLTEIESASEAGRTFRVLQIASRLHRAFEREAGETPLLEQMAGVLPTEHAQELRRLVDEYWRALAVEEGGEDVGRIEAYVVERRASLELFGKEVERAFERVSMEVGDGAGWERLLAALELTPEQERKIRTMGEAFYIESRLRPTREEIAGFLTRVYMELDETQRARLFWLVVKGKEAQE